MSTIDSFGRRVRERRRDLGLTQAELAERVNCSEITIRKIEAGERTPSKQIAELLARALAVADAEYAAFMAGARGDAVPPAPLLAAPLPMPMTRLLGRDADVTAIRRQLTNQSTRLLTVVGPPGIGKTRLSLEVAAALHDAFAEGVVFVPLAPVGDAALVLPTIGQALGVGEHSGDTLFGGIRALLERRRVLLTLDNFEHVLDAAAEIARLLEACPGLHILATSRAALFVRGEQVYPLAPLALPRLTFPLETGDVARAPAVQLFVERARAVAPQFALGDENAAAVAAICARLDGLPLAIELAAARARLLSPLALLNRLGQRYLLHGAGPRDLPPRHQTLHNAIVWSYNLLTDEERKLFATLGVFVGEYSLEALEAVYESRPLEAPAVFELVTALADHHLLQIAEGAAGEIRLSMLETIREFALERLVESGAFEPVHERYIAYYTAFAAHADTELNGPEQEHWLHCLEREHDQFRAALAWVTQHLVAGTPADPRLNAGRRLGAHLWRFWYTRCHLSEGRRWLAALLAVDPGSSAESARMLLGAGVLARAQGDYDAGWRLIDRSLSTARQCGAAAEMALALYHRGVAAFENGEVGPAIVDLEECLVIQRARDDLAGIANTLNGLGSVLIGSDDQRAAHLLDESVQLQRRLGNRRGEAFTTHSLGLAHLRRAEYDNAREDFARGLGLFQALGDSIGIADCLAGLAAGAGAQNLLERAAQLWQAAETLRDQVGAPLNASERAVYLAYLPGITLAFDEPDLDLAALIRHELA